MGEAFLYRVCNSIYPIFAFSLLHYCLDGLCILFIYILLDLYIGPYRDRALALYLSLFVTCIYYHYFCICLFLVPPIYIFILSLPYYIYRVLCRLIDLSVYVRFLSLHVFYCWD